MMNELDKKMVKRAGFAQSWGEPPQTASRSSCSSLFYNGHSKAVATNTSLVATSTTIGSYSEETVSEPIDNEEFQKQLKLVNECLDANEDSNEPKPLKLPYSYVKKCGCDCEKNIQEMTTRFQEKITSLTQHIDRSYNDLNRLVNSGLEYEYDKMMSKKMAEIDRDAKQRLAALEEENKAHKRENQAIEEKVTQLERHVKHLQEVLGIQKALETLSLGEGGGRTKKTKK